MQIKNVLLDLDNTILDFDTAERAAITKTLRTLGIEPTDAIAKRYSEINLMFWEKLERGEINRRQTLVGRFAALFEELGVSVEAGLAEDTYENFLCIGHYFVPGAEQLLETLHGKYHLYICSNGSKKVQDSRIASSGIAKCFDGIFISEELGLNKPDKRYFEACFAQIPDFKRESSIMVGDSLTSDIKGAHNAGLRSVWFNPAHKAMTGDAAPDYEIDALEKLPILLAELSEVGE